MCSLRVSKAINKFLWSKKNSRESKMVDTLAAFFFFSFARSILGRHHFLIWFALNSLSVVMGALKWVWIKSLCVRDSELIFSASKHSSLCQHLLPHAPVPCSCLFPTTMHPFKSGPRLTYLCVPRMEHGAQHWIGDDNSNCPLSASLYLALV